ncbi:hypothetical protein GJAV_G00126820 [Gymnothorax javanicus]|nr:hypothetical protein GJAV_G00126820 [Gymnothorax javanicus]
MILPSFYSSLRSRNLSIGHILTFSPVNPVSMGDEDDSDQSDNLSGTESDLGPAHNLPPGRKRGRVRVLSESEASSAIRGAEPEFQDGSGGEETPFRGRSQSAPAALWAQTLRSPTTPNERRVRHLAGPGGPGGEEGTERGGRASDKDFQQLVLLPVEPPGD